MDRDLLMLVTSVSSTPLIDVKVLNRVQWSSRVSSVPHTPVSEFLGDCTCSPLWSSMVLSRQDLYGSFILGVQTWGTPPPNKTSGGKENLGYLVPGQAAMGHSGWAVVWTLGFLSSARVIHVLWRPFPIRMFADVFLSAMFVMVIVAN